MRDRSDAGAVVGSDMITILRGAKNPVLAHHFLNFLLDNKHGVDNFSWMGYMPPLNVINPDKVVDYGQSGRAMLTTLTKEFFMPGFLERDEGERERPCEQFPWDGISGVRPFRRLAEATTVGVY